MISNGDSIGGCNGGGGGSGSDSGDQMDNEQREREIARRKEEAKRKRRKKKRTGSSLVSSCFQGKTKLQSLVSSNRIPTRFPKIETDYIYSRIST